MSQAGEAARAQALRYLSHRGYGYQELYDKLCRAHDEHDAAAAVAEMVELGLLNDSEYAELKARGLAQRGKSRREIRFKLASLGLDEDDIDAALEAAAPDDGATALALVHKLYMDKLRAGKREAVMAALARRGFRYGDIRDALEEARDELEEDDENEEYG